MPPESKRRASDSHMSAKDDRGTTEIDREHGSLREIQPLVWRLWNSLRKPPSGDPMDPADPNGMGGLMPNKPTSLRELGAS